jgi:hypothetical protein
MTNVDRIVPQPQNINLTVVGSSRGEETERIEIGRSGRTRWGARRVEKVGEDSRRRGGRWKGPGKVEEGTRLEEAGGTWGGWRSFKAGRRSERCRG